ncbi:MAG: site-2 protease family protein [Candidatus Thermoplasmatota archaeon]|nr:site-2 protease family protein [Candidatus Thermoplasmatota archaeon]
MIEMILFLAVIVIWSVAIILLDRFKFLERYNMSRIWAVVLMWRTEKGKGLIEKMASPKRFWDAFAVIGLFILFIGMLSMFLLIFASTLTVILAGFTKTISAKEVLVLPGINPYVPLIYGLIGLIFAVVVHEFSHGIQATANKIKVRSLGILFFIVPIGAFMEPDEDEVKASSRIKKIKMYASGPIINFIFAFVFIILFSGVMMSSLSSPGDPFTITDISDNSSLFYSNEYAPVGLFDINGTELSSVNDIYEYKGPEPGSWISVTMKTKDGFYRFPAISGVVIYSITDDSPADKQGIIKGSIILSMNERSILSRKDVSDVLDPTLAGQNLTISLLEPQIDHQGEPMMEWDPPSWLNYSIDKIGDVNVPSYIPRTIKLTLADKYRFIPLEDFKGKGFLGIGSSFLGVTGVGSKELLSVVKSPLSSSNGPFGAVGNLMYITFSLPLSRTIVPFHSPLIDVYEVSGPLSILPDPVFWFITNCFFYLFWLNILLALFNSLPAYPLDGGFIFKDSLILIIKNFNNRIKDEKLEKIAGSITMTLTIMVFTLILITFMYPWIKMVLMGL